MSDFHQFGPVTAAAAAFSRGRSKTSRLTSSRSPRIPGVARDSR